MPKRPLTLAQAYVATRRTYGPHIERAVRARLMGYDPHQPLSRAEARRVMDMARVAHALEQELAATTSRESKPVLSWSGWLGQVGDCVQALLGRTRRPSRQSAGDSSAAAH